jgi:hypothetical protein
LPTIEKGIEQLSTVYEIALVFFKNPALIEAFLSVYCLALLVQALIERQLHLVNNANRHADLPRYAQTQQTCHESQSRLSSK